MAQGQKNALKNVALLFIPVKQHPREATACQENDSGTRDTASDEYTTEMIDNNKKGEYNR